MAAYATCECEEPIKLPAKMAAAKVAFVGQVTAARVEVLGEYRYFRAPGKLSWTAESETPVDVQRVSEVRVSKDRVIHAKFESIKTIKGSYGEAEEITMGDANCPMPVAIGGVYLVVSIDGSTTSHCDGARQYDGWRDPNLLELFASP